MMRRLFELIEKREDAIKVASQSKEAFLAAAAKYLGGKILRNPLNTVSAVSDAYNLGASTSQAADLGGPLPAVAKPGGPTM